MDEGPKTKPIRADVIERERPQKLHNSKEGNTPNAVRNIRASEQSDEPTRSFGEIPNEAPKLESTGGSVRPRDDIAKAPTSGPEAIDQDATDIAPEERERREREQFLFSTQEGYELRILLEDGDTTETENYVIDRYKEKTGAAPDGDELQRIQNEIATYTIEHAKRQQAQYVYETIRDNLNDPLEGPGAQGTNDIFHEEVNTIRQTGSFDRERIREHLITSEFGLARQVRLAMAQQQALQASPYLPPLIETKSPHQMVMEQQFPPLVKDVMDMAANQSADGLLDLMKYATGPIIQAKTHLKEHAKNTQVSDATKKEQENPIQEQQRLLKEVQKLISLQRPQDALTHELQLTLATLQDQQAYRRALGTSTLNQYKQAIEGAQNTGAIQLKEELQTAEQQITSLKETLADTEEILDHHNRHQQLLIKESLSKSGEGQQLSEEERRTLENANQQWGEQENMMSKIGRAIKNTMDQRTAQQTRLDALYEHKKALQNKLKNARTITAGGKTIPAGLDFQTFETVTAEFLTEQERNGTRAVMQRFVTNEHRTLQAFANRITNQQDFLTTTLPAIELSGSTFEEWLRNYKLEYIERDDIRNLLRTQEIFLYSQQEPQISPESIAQLLERREMLDTAYRNHRNDLQANGEATIVPIERSAQAREHEQQSLRKKILREETALTVEQLLAQQASAEEINTVIATYLQETPKPQQTRAALRDELIELRQQFAQLNVFGEVQALETEAESNAVSETTELQLRMWDLQSQLEAHDEQDRIYLHIAARYQEAITELRIEQNRNDAFAEQYFKNREDFLDRNMPIDIRVADEAARSAWKDAQRDAIQETMDDATLDKLQELLEALDNNSQLLETAQAQHAQLLNAYKEYRDGQDNTNVPLETLQQEVEFFTLNRTLPL